MHKSLVILHTSKVRVEGIRVQEKIYFRKTFKSWQDSPQRVQLALNAEKEHNFKIIKVIMNLTLETSS